MSVEWIDHKGKKILYIKYAGLTSEEKLDQIDKAVEILSSTKSNSNLTLTDIRETFIDQEFMDKSKIRGKVSKEFTKKAAILGVDGLRKIMLKTVNAFSGNPREPFNTMEEAKEWLIKD